MTEEMKRHMQELLRGPATCLNKPVLVVCSGSDLNARRCSEEVGGQCARLFDFPSNVRHAKGLFGCIAGNEVVGCKQVHSLSISRSQEPRRGMMATDG